MSHSEMLEPHLCPICGKYEFVYLGSFRFCEVCGWQDDTNQEEFPDEGELANELSLNEYWEKYKTGWIPDWLADERMSDSSGK